MEQLSKQFTKFNKKQLNKLEYILPVALGISIIVIIVLALTNKREKENYKNKEKNNFPWWGYMIVILVSGIILYFMYESFKNKTFISSGKNNTEQLLKNKGYKKLSSNIYN